MFLDLAQWIPAIYAKFGYTKGPVKAWVADNNAGYGIFWCTHPTFNGCTGQTDIIFTNQRRVFGTQAPNDGLFVTVHEYSHGYHWFAVENWGLEFGGCAGHDWAEKSSLGCSFTEGVANWITALTLGSVIDVSPYNGDYGMENNLYEGSPTNPPPPPENDGVLVESAASAFLYDVVDNGTELDGLGNQVGAVEGFDNLAGSPNGVLARIRYCKLNGSITKLSGLDQFVYCLEGNPTAYTEAQFLSPAWRSYSSVTFEQSVPPLHPAKVRALWEWNLYGIP